MTDLAKIGLPLQVGGVIVGIAGIASHWILAVGFIVHIVGDVFFYLEMKRRGCV